MSLELFFEMNGISPKKINQRSFIFDCPNCHGTQKLYIQRKDGRTSCFKQGDSGCPRPGSKPDYALAAITGLSLETVRDQLYKDYAPLKEEIDISALEDKKAEERPRLLPITTQDIPGDTFPIGFDESTEGVRYLTKRGITLEMAKKYGIMYSRGMRRVIFPVIMGSQIYGWQGRAVDNVDKKFRMFNLPGQWKAKSLMFYDNIKNKEFAILAEGPISAMKFELVGGFVASMGKQVSQDQLDLIENSGIKKLYLALDRDAFENADRIFRYFYKKIAKIRIECYNLRIPDHRDDFGDCTYEECKQAFENAELLNIEDIIVNFED
jgi:hypothetical protein